MRSGDEPAHARSPLRMRFWLALWGLLWTLAGTLAFALTDRPGWATFCAILAAAAAVDLAVVRHRIRQGAHYQPGPTVPPYHPVDDDEHRPPKD
ncbi:hypothetical protein G5C51_30060 [Streptomyces sp. A7024]|uniref:Uncharacterized protein n=1 Tax=Streptomyces coryli TaxID=1128680 RepID=A0A6G4U804_9ACTN|nr:hypothetical protein [Streptomyces coryli]